MLNSSLKIPIFFSLLIHTGIILLPNSLFKQNKPIILIKKRKELPIKFISIQTAALKKTQKAKKQKSEVRRQKTEDRRQKTENKKQTTEDIIPKTENKKLKTEDSRQKSGNRRQKTEDRNQRTDNRQQTKKLKTKQKKSFNKAQDKLKTISNLNKIEPIPKKMQKIDSIPISVKITDAVQEARLKGIFKPKYPSISRRKGEHGNVLLKIFIDEYGRVEIVKLLKSSGYSRLDNSALKGAYNIQFYPAEKGNTFSPSSRTLNVKFELNG